jgi:hypothetical protein
MSMNRQQRRYASRQHAKVHTVNPDELLEVDRIVVFYTDGRQSTLDMSKVTIVAKDSGLPIFDYQEEASIDTTTGQPEGTTII